MYHRYLQFLVLELLLRFLQFFCYRGYFSSQLGLKTLFAKQSEQTASVKGSGIFGAYVSTFFLTLTNPITILSFVAIFSGLGLANTSHDYVSAGTLVLGVFFGSTSWWLLLSTGVSILREKFNQRGLCWVNRISGVIIMSFGLFALLSTVW